MLAVLLTGLLGVAPQQPTSSTVAAAPAPPPLELDLATRDPTLSRLDSHAPSA